MLIKLSAVDTLFFRDAKAFSMREESWAQGIFPPYPSTFYGALRAEYFSNHMDEFELRETPDDPTKSLQIKGIFLSIDEELYIPLPNDILLEKSYGKETLYKTSLFSLSKNNILSSCTYDLILKAAKKVEGISNGWIKSEALVNYLKNDAIEEDWTIEPEKLHKEEEGDELATIIRLANHIEQEPKVGIKISYSSRAAEEHYLYSLNRVRPKNLNLIVDFNFESRDASKDASKKNTVELGAKNGIMRLGGRGGKVKFDILNSNHHFQDKIKDLENISTQNMKKILESGELFKIYFETPSIFSDYYNPNPLKNLYNGINFEIKSCAIEKPLYIGGFNMKKGEPRAMFKAIPSGCLYFLKGEAKEGFDSNIFPRNLSEFYSEKGFGVSYIGLRQSNNKNK